MMTFLVVTLKTQVFTVATNAQNTLQHFQGELGQVPSFFSKGAPAFVEERGPVPWHNGSNGQS